MSRVAKRPVALPQGVTAAITPSQVTIKGAKGSLNVAVGNGVSVKEENKELQVSYTDVEGAAALAGATRAHLANVVQGVTAGFEKKLDLVGVGYRAAVQGKVLTLTLGYSHPIVYDVPEGITIESPSQTEVLVKGIDRQRVGQVAAEIRSFRSPEPYKGKGVKYSDEKITLKEGKKK